MSITKDKDNGCAILVVVIIAYLSMAVLFIVWILGISGCGEGESQSPTAPVPAPNVNISMPGVIKTEEIKPLIGAKLAWTTEMWRLGKLRDNEGNDIINFYRLWLLIKLENIGDRAAINIKPLLNVKTHFGNSPRITLAERNLDDTLAPKEAFYATFTLFLETADNIWDDQIWIGVDNIGKAGLIIKVDFTYDTEVTAKG